MTRSPLSGESILVTGGAGFIGSATVGNLLRKIDDVTVRVLDDFSFGSPSNIVPSGSYPGLELIHGDIRDSQAVKDALDGINVVIHLAARPFIPEGYLNPALVADVNVNGSLNLLVQALDSDTTRLVHISSSEVYGSSRRHTMSEEHPTNPLSTYATSKLAAESIVASICREHSFPFVILRPFNCYGPYDTHPRIVPLVISQLHRGDRLILGNLSSIRDFTYVDDVAAGIVAACTHREAVGEVINLGTGDETTLDELIRIIAEKSRNRRYRIVAESSRFRPFDVERQCADVAKAERVLEWRARVPLEEGIARTIEWFVDNGAMFSWEGKDYARYPWYPRRTTRIRN